MSGAKTIDEQVASYLTSKFILYEARYCGETKRDGWECDLWLVKFQAGRDSMETQFHTGLGLRKPVKPQAGGQLGARELNDGHRKNDKVQAPSAACVLHSLLMDAEALDTSFEYWCSEMGADSDSIKSLHTYQACCAIGKEVKQVFSSEARAELQRLLQDY